MGFEAIFVSVLYHPFQVLLAGVVTFHAIHTSFLRAGEGSKTRAWIRRRYAAAA